MASRGGLAKKASQLLNKYVFRREPMGSDIHGNQYFRNFQKQDDGTEKERRFVKTAGDYDPLKIPAEWNQWLHKTRVEAPTEEEVQDMARRRLLMKERTAAIEAEEKRRRLQAEALGRAGSEPASGPDMDRFTEQLTAKGYGRESGGADVATDNSAEGSGSKGGESPVEKKDEAEPTGSGNEFRPGTWQPGR